MRVLRVGENERKSDIGPLDHALETTLEDVVEIFGNPVCAMIEGDGEDIRSDCPFWIEVKNRCGDRPEPGTGSAAGLRCSADLARCVSTLGSLSDIFTETTVGVE